MDTSWRERIVIDPEIHHGDACIKGTRVPVSMIAGSLTDGMTQKEILDEYPQLTPDDIAAAVGYTAFVHKDSEPQANGLSYLMLRTDNVPPKSVTNVVETGDQVANPLPI